MYTQLLTNMVYDSLYTNSIQYTVTICNIRVAYVLMVKNNYMLMY
jgi:hypothetical protein